MIISLLMLYLLCNFVPIFINNVYTNNVFRLDGAGDDGLREASQPRRRQSIHRRAAACHHTCQEPGGEQRVLDVCHALDH